MRDPTSMNTELKMPKRKRVEVSKVEKIMWEKLKSYKNREENIFESQKTKAEVAEKESRWGMIWKKNWRWWRVEAEADSLEKRIGSEERKLKRTSMKKEEN